MDYKMQAEHLEREYQRSRVPSNVWDRNNKPIIISVLRLH